MTKRSIEHHTQQAGGTQFHYLRSGTGPPLLLLHGCPQTSHAWRFTLPRLADTYTVIAPDLPGLGYSKRLPNHEKHAVAAAIRELVKSLGFERLFITGHDIGGMVAYAYAAAFPNEVERLAVIESGPTFPAQALDFSKGLGLWHVPFHMAPEIPEMLVGGRERAYLEQFFRLAYNPKFLAESDLQEYTRCYAAPGSLRAYFDYYRALPQDNERAEQNKQDRLSVPILAIGAELSLGVFAEYPFREVADNVQGYVLARCGQWALEEKPDELTEQLMTFFSKGTSK